MRLHNPLPARKADPEVRRADRTLKAVLIGLMAAVVLTGLSAAAPAEAPEPSAEPEPPRPGPIEFSGVASWYGEYFRGRTTACGVPYDPDAISAAHRTLPCWARVRVEHGERSIVVTITDRGPYVPGRHLDLSRGAFAELAPVEEGLIDVRATVLTP